jgi:hypothetical protein
MVLMDGKKEKQKRKTVETDRKRKTNKIRKKNRTQDVDCRPMEKETNINGE